MKKFPALFMALAMGMTMGRKAGVRRKADGRQCLRRPGGHPATGGKQRQGG